MIIEIISTGDEVLTGFVVDTNSAWLCQRLLDHGWQVRRRQTVGDRMDDLVAVKTNYATIVRQELDYRGQSHTLEQVLQDSFETALTLSLRGQINPEQYAQLEAGVKKIQPFIFSQSFHLETAILCAAKAAYLVALLLSRQTTAERYSSTESAATLMINHPGFNKLNRLKKTSPEAFFYWCQAVALHGESAKI